MSGGKGFLVVMGALVLMLCSCQGRQSRSEAERAMAEELAARKEGRARSMRLYREGMDLEEAGKAVEAQRRLWEAVVADKHNVYAWMGLGTVNFGLEDYFGAAEAFYEASRLAPSRYEPHHNLGLVYESVGRLDDAIKSYEVALRLEGEELSVIENLARALIRARRNPDRARELMERALARENRPEWRQWLERQSVRLAGSAGSVAERSVGGR